MSRHDHTVGAIPADRTGSHSARRTLPDVAGPSACAWSPLLAARDAEIRLRERQLAALVAEGYFVVRAR